MSSHVHEPFNATSASSSHATIRDQFRASKVSMDSIASIEGTLPRECRTDGLRVIESFRVISMASDRAFIRHRLDVGQFSSLLSSFWFRSILKYSIF